MKLALSWLCMASIVISASVFAEEPLSFKGVTYAGYWEDVPAEQAVGYALSRLALLEHRLPGKRIVITETGWPSAGDAHGKSVPSTRAQRAYLTDFSREAQARGIDYFIIEGFDQPWKHVLEGAVGGYWGVFDANRRSKL